MMGASVPKLAPDVPQPGPEPVGPPPDATAGRKVHFPGEDGGRSLNEMAERDLEATLQLLAERAQYITGATGAAIALRDGPDIVCRASAGSVAPEIGAHLQMESGLSGESIRTKQILRCDDAQTDTRVNRESCEALGIASVVVMPLLRENEVNGVFELLSDHPYAFEERDIGALERLGEMVQTALDHVAAARNAAEPTIPKTLAVKPQTETLAAESAEIIESSPDESSSDAEPRKAEIELDMAEILVPLSPAADARKPEAAVGAVEDKEHKEQKRDTEKVEVEKVEVQKKEASVPVAQAPAPESETLEPFVADVPEFVDLDVAKETPKIAGVSQVGKCSACGFPVSEGRTLCLDCEKKEKTTPAAQPAQASATEDVAAPLFTMGKEEGVQDSWIARNRVLIGVVAVVVVLVIVLFLFR